MTERGPHHRVWRRAVRVTDASGRGRTNVQQYVELGTGMHYWAEGQWQETQELIESYPAGALARRGPHQVIFANNLNTAGAVDLQTPDGQRLRSHVVGLSYFDAASGQGVLFAQLQDSLGGLLPPNQVLYTNAFSGVNADVRYTYRRAGLEQDVILRERPPSPALWGLDPRTTRLQVLTEFLEGPTPRSRVVSVRGDPARVDVVLDFGAMRIRSGQAFGIGAAGEAGRPVRVTKQWLLLESRRFLVEEVPFAALEPQWRTLPAAVAAAGAKPLTGRGESVIAALGGRLPPPGAVRRAGAVEVARLGAWPRAGVVLDYQILGGASDFTFRGDTTYYCTNLVELDGTTVLEGGAVIKFSTNATAMIFSPDGVECRTGPYRPAIFTAKDDNTVGETIAGSTGDPSGKYYGYRALFAYQAAAPLHDLRFAYQNGGLDVTYGDTELRNVQFVRCRMAVVNEEATLAVRNCLFHEVGQAFAGPAWITGEHLTIDHCGKLFDGWDDGWNSTLKLTNCLGAAVSDGGSHYALSSESTHLRTDDPGWFQSVGAGSHYLAENSPYRDAGTANIHPALLAELKTKTTYPPEVPTGPITSDTTWGPRSIRDTDTPDLGYHYDVLDYLVHEVAVADATLQLSGGAALGVVAGTGEAGIVIQDGGILISEGSPVNLNRVVRYHAVQEQASAGLGGPGIGGLIGTSLSGLTGQAQLRFTMLGGQHELVRAGGLASVDLSDCQFYGGSVSVSGFYPDVGAWHVKNCLFARVLFPSPFDAVAATFHNNLFLGGALDLDIFGGSSFTFRDNMFDRTMLNDYGAEMDRDYNGYVAGFGWDEGWGEWRPTANDVVINALTYAAGPLGAFYHGATDLVDAGSRSAAEAGLYHYTTQVNQTREATSPVDIGFHYVAVDANGNPADTEGDGVPDYLEDRNGDGVFDTGDLGDWLSPNRAGDCLPDGWKRAHGFDLLVNAAYDDADGDGFNNLEEYGLGTDPRQPNVAAPWFNPVGRSYAGAQTVTITCPTPGATIHYTLNGNDPTESDPTIPSGASLLINATATLKARAWQAGGTPSDVESQRYDITANPQNQPPVLSVAPPDGSQVPASGDLEILVEASDADGVIGRVQLYRDDYKIAETTASPLRWTLCNPPSGHYTFTAKAVDNLGAVTVSSPVTITVGAAALAVSLSGVQPFFTSSPGTLIASITGVDPGALTSLTLNGAPLVARTGDFEMPVTLIEDENTFTLAATDNANRSASATTKVYLDSIAPTISITSPANNASFSTDRINVTGTFTEANLKRITVNGVLAFVTGNTFEALNVPLAEGANAITATAEDIAGNTGTAAITVTGSDTPVDPVQLTATPVAGIVPLAVTFQVVNNAPGTFQEILYDFNGDNVTDQTAGNLNPLSHTYTAAGEYFPVATVVTSVGRFSSAGGWNGGFDRLRINVQSPPVQIGTALSVTDPVDLKTTANGHLFVLSRSTATITEYNSSHTVVRSKSSIGTTPTGLDVDADGNVYVALSGDDQIARFKPDGSTFQLDETFGNSGLVGGSGSGEGEFNAPFDVAVSPDGTEIAVSDSGNHRIQRFNTADGDFIGAFGESGSGPGQFNSPKGLTYDETGYLYIVDSGNNRVVLTLSSSVIGASGTAGTALGQFQGALNLATGARGIYVADSGNDRVQQFDSLSGGHGAGQTPFNPRGAMATELTPALSEPNSVATVSDLLEEKIYIADTGNSRVVLIKLPVENPDSVWNAMTDRLINHQDVPGAIAHFSRMSAEAYREAFFYLGLTKAIADINDVGSLTPVFIENDRAQYYFEQTVEGHLLLFPVDFVRENGAWKILEF